MLQVVWDFPRHAAEGFHNLNLTKLGWERHGQWEPQDSSEEPPPRKAASRACGTWRGPAPRKWMWEKTRKKVGENQKDDYEIFIIYSISLSYGTSYFILLDT